MRGETPQPRREWGANPSTKAAGGGGGGGGGRKGDPDSEEPPFVVIRQQIVRALGEDGRGDGGQLRIAFRLDKNTLYQDAQGRAVDSAIQYCGDPGFEDALAKDETDKFCATFGLSTAAPPAWGRSKHLPQGGAKIPHHDDHHPHGYADLGADEPLPDKAVCKTETHGMLPDPMKGTVMDDLHRTERLTDLGAHRSLKKQVSGLKKEKRKAEVARVDLEHQLAATKNKAEHLREVEEDRDRRVAEAERAAEWHRKRADKLEKELRAQHHRARALSPRQRAPRPMVAAASATAAPDDVPPGSGPPADGGGGGGDENTAPPPPPPPATEENAQPLAPPPPPDTKQERWWQRFHKTNSKYVETKTERQRQRQLELAQQQQQDELELQSPPPKMSETKTKKLLRERVSRDTVHDRNERLLQKREALRQSADNASVPHFRAKVPDRKRMGYSLTIDVNPDKLRKGVAKFQTHEAVLKRKAKEREERYGSADSVGKAPEEMNIYHRDKKWAEERDARIEAKRRQQHAPKPPGRVGAATQSGLRRSLERKSERPATDRMRASTGDLNATKAAETMQAAPVTTEFWDGVDRMAQRLEDMRADEKRVCKQLIAMGYGQTAPKRAKETLDEFKERVRVEKARVTQVVAELYADTVKQWKAKEKVTTQERNAAIEALVLKAEKRLHANIQREKKEKAKQLKEMKAANFEVKMTGKIVEHRAALVRQKAEDEAKKKREKQLERKMYDLRHALEANHSRNTGEDRIWDLHRTLISGKSLQVEDAQDYSNETHEEKADRIFAKMGDFAANHHLRTRDMFNSIDVDKSGTISKVELVDAIAKFTGIELAVEDEAMTLMWSRLDQDGNGVVDWQVSRGSALTSPRPARSPQANAPPSHGPSPPTHTPTPTRTRVQELLGELQRHRHAALRKKKEEEAADADAAADG